MKKKRVLVVDDEPEIVYLLSLRLGHKGYEVLTTTSGAEAVEMVRREEPDIMLLDVVMPEFSGMDVLGKVREFSRVPVIVFTSSEEVARLVRQMGADDCVAKPFDMPVMLGKMQALLGP